MQIPEKIKKQLQEIIGKTDLTINDYISLIKNGYLKVGAGFTSDRQWYITYDHNDKCFKLHGWNYRELKRAEVGNMLKNSTGLWFEILNPIIRIMAISYTSYNIEKYEEAINSYSRAHKLEPENNEVYNSRALCYLRLKKYKRAVADYTKAISLKPEDPVAYTNRAHCYKQKGLYKKALMDYDKAIELSPHKAKYLYNRGLLYERKKLFSKVLKDFSEAIKLNAEYHKVYASRGFIHIEQGAYNKALKDFIQALKIYKNNKDALFGLAISYYLLEKNKLAIKTFKKLLVIDKHYNNAIGELLKQGYYYSDKVISISNKLGKLIK